MPQSVTVEYDPMKMSRNWAVIVDGERVSQHSSAESAEMSAESAKIDVSPDRIARAQTFTHTGQGPTHSERRDALVPLAMAVGGIVVHWPVKPGDIYTAAYVCTADPSPSPES